jgi:phosphatidylserine/phosphatidylglycerophosphate/cardiolipin synthase-like enzyme
LKKNNFLFAAAALYAFSCLAICSISGAAQKSRDNWWKLFFTAPGAYRDIYSKNNPENGIMNAIGSAKKSFCGAFYDISAPRIIDAILRAKNRGIEIRIVTELDNSKKREFGRITSAEIPVVCDNRKGFMHNKFAIIDDEYVWTGSYNLTENCSGKNNNNAIMIKSPDLAKIFKAEFNEMFDDRVFGNKRDTKPLEWLTNKYYVKIEETDINIYFSPDDNVERIILKRIKKAELSIHFMAFSLTSDPIGEAIIEKHKSGVEVYGLFERKGSRDRNSEYIKMKVEGLNVKPDKSRGMMHHKVIIIDKKIVITGSYNFSKNANKKNDENILIINNSEIANEYLKEFERLFR